MTADGTRNERKIILRNSAITFCSALGSSLLFMPARHFSNIVFTFILSKNQDNPLINGVSIFCGIASVSARTTVSFNAWDKFLSLPEKNLKAISKRILFYLGGVSTTLPLIFDSYSVNKKNNISTPVNLLITIIPGAFMSGVYGQAIQFLCKELFINNSTESHNKTMKYTSLGISVPLGIISAIGSYWTTLNTISPYVDSMIYSSILSAIPVVCRAPLFIKGNYVIYGSVKSFSLFFVSAIIQVL